MLNRVRWLAAFSMQHPLARDAAIARTLTKRFGGLWVGGALSVYDDRVRFEPNRANRLIHAGDVSFDIPWSAVTKLGWRRALLTNVVEISWNQDVQTVRCFGARRIF
jgi:hypothetical protein